MDDWFDAPAKPLPVAQVTQALARGECPYCDVEIASFDAAARRRHLMLAHPAAYIAWAKEVAP